MLFPSERQTNVSKRNLKLKPSDPIPAIDWAAVDATALADVPDDDSPELTLLQAAELRPLGESSMSKTRVSIMLDASVIAYFRAKAAGRGYQTLINQALHQAMAGEQIEATLRRVIREELHA